MHPRRPRWKPPDQGYVKTNFDGAIFEDLHVAGICVVIQNDQGEVLVALAEKILIPESMLTLEILAARRTIQFAHELGIHISIF